VVTKFYAPEQAAAVLASMLCDAPNAVHATSGARDSAITAAIGGGNSMAAAVS
jgi:hypothetical protein